MCGISGFIPFKPAGKNGREIVERMNARLSHRGPDNTGIWQNDEVCLGHTRLSIIDLSRESNQPFSSDDGRFIIVYNGELYNYRELKLELQRAPHGSGQQPYFFKTASDTEVILAAYIRWGTKCLDYFNGMFAFAIYDLKKKKLLLARDRMGVKPLYYYQGKEGLIFSSEVRAIIHSGLRSFRINNSAMAEYIMYQTVHAPRTIVEDIKMLMPGHFAEFADGKLAFTQYYDLHKAVNGTVDMSYRDTCDKVSELLTLSVQRRLVADVPFGAFLSGGIDSSAIVGLMSRVSTSRIKTFNVSFDRSEFSESVYAKQIAGIFNTEHHEIRLSADDFLKTMPEALRAMDHPSGDGPNTYVVSKATKEAGITMALSGIGGDELFAGYPVFKRMHQLQHKWWLQASPPMLRKLAAQALRSIKKDVAGQKMAELLGKKELNFQNAYLITRSLFTESDFKKIIPGIDPHSEIRHIVDAIPHSEAHLLSAVSLAETGTYLQNILLRDTDQMSMAVALEVREPFLDHHLVEFVLGIKDDYKYPHTPKKLLTDSLSGLLPSEIINRPKMGFTFPWEHWLKNELRSFAETNIREFAQTEGVNGKQIIENWNRFLKGDKKISWSRIWHIIVLNHWMKNNGFA